MGTLIRNDPKGEIQTAINELVKQSIEMFAPCLIAGHTPDEAARFGHGAYRIQPDNDAEMIDVKLCARCGVVYEEKAK